MVIRLADKATFDIGTFAVDVFLGQCDGYDFNRFTKNKMAANMAIMLILTIISNIYLGGFDMDKLRWLLCPVCKNKTRIKLLENTVLTNFPLVCPKCKKETLINVRQLNITIIKEPDA